MSDLTGFNGDSVIFCGSVRYLRSIHISPERRHAIMSGEIGIVVQTTYGSMRCAVNGDVSLVTFNRRDYVIPLTMLQFVNPPALCRPKLKQLELVV